jgi:cysteinyl-tRNA synthetase
MEWSLEYLEQARNGLGRINNFVRLIDAQLDDTENETVVAKFREDFYNHLDNDFDTPAAVALLFELIREQNKFGSPGVRILNLMQEINTFFDFISFTSGSLEMEIENLIQARQELRSQRKSKRRMNYATVFYLRALFSKTRNRECAGDIENPDYGTGSRN